MLRGASAVRGTYDHAYVNYTLGKLMIRKLRDDWTATRGGEMHGRFFMMRSWITAVRRFPWCGAQCSEHERARLCEHPMHMT